MHESRPSLLIVDDSPEDRAVYRRYRGIDLAELAVLTFEHPDEKRFLALALARQVMQRGGLAPTVLNAANEIAVEAFLTGEIKFLHIAQLVADTLEAADARGLMTETSDLSGVLAADAAARELALDLRKSRALT